MKVFKICCLVNIKYKICRKYFCKARLYRTKSVFIFIFIIALFVRVSKDVCCELQQGSLSWITPKAWTRTITYLVAPKCVIQIRFAYYETTQLRLGRFIVINIKVILLA
jgi:hypothetical protein